MRQQIIKSLASLLVGLLVGLALLSIPVFADWRNLKGKDFSLVAPPAPGSPEFSEDFKILHELEKTRTLAQCEMAKDQRESSFKNFFKDKDDLLSPIEYDRHKPLMKDVGRMVDRVAEHFKADYLRTRPYLTDPTLKPCLEPVPSGNKSYPSAHAMMGYVFACTLAHKFPERSANLMTYGKYVGELRAIVGLHHPSDIKAGQSLGQEICNRLLADGDFVRELNLQ